MPTSAVLTYSAASDPVMCVSVTLLPDDVTEDQEVFLVVGSSSDMSATFATNNISVIILDNDSEQIACEVKHYQLCILNFSLNCIHRRDLLCCQ